MSELQLNVSNKSLGVGDTLSGLYAVAGLRKKHPDAKINYYTPNPKWANLATGVNNFHIDKRNGVYTKELYYDYQAECEQEADRKKWYCKALDVDPAKPEIKPIGEKIHEKEKYIVLAPGCAWHTRSWNIAGWMYLETLINQYLRINTVIVGGKKEADILNLFNGAKYCATTPENIANLVHHAECTVSNDSLAAHVAGLLDAPVLALIAMYRPDAVFSLMPSVFPVVPNIPCRFCYQKEEKGYRTACNLLCSGLASITPYMVFDKLRYLLKYKESQNADTLQKSPKNQQGGVRKKTPGKISCVV